VRICRSFSLSFISQKLYSCSDSANQSCRCISPLLRQDQQTVAFLRGGDQGGDSRLNTTACVRAAPLSTPMKYMFLAHGD
ncbi:MAG: hypothetical protein VYA46_01505, partial [Verrucomicrobiota bacterium]|nr:hypothetical protein [Verrucomicrobiota bacterium]